MESPSSPNSLALATTQRHCGAVVVRIVAFLTIQCAVSTTALTLEAGQRLAPRANSSGGARILFSKQQQQQQSVVNPSLPPLLYSIFDLPRLEQWATERGLREHHLKTVYRVVLHAESTTAENLKDRLLQASFPKAHAVDLLSKFRLCCSTLVETRPFVSGGMKLVLRLSSGKLVETVVIRHNTKNKAPRYTVCVSSQVGCARACSFCATGTLGFQAQLSSAEILEQVYVARSAIDDPAALRNVVFMGMGEPLDNWHEVHAACRGLTHQCLFGLSAKQVTISTVGTSPDHIRQLADEAPQINLAISLHGATQQLREALMPATKRIPLVELEAALDYHSKITGSGVMVEYLLIDGINDDAKAAAALITFCLNQPRKLYINLIPYNPTIAGIAFGYQTPSDEAIRAFHERLQSAGIKSHVRWSSAAGRDADGACGQLVLSISSIAME